MKRMIVPARPLRMAPQSPALLLRSSLDACITSLSEPASGTQLGFQWPYVQIDCQVQKISSELSQAKLFCFISFHSVGRMQYQEIAFAVCADG
jgi:hypothetical protein